MSPTLFLFLTLQQELLPKKTTLCTDETSKLGKTMGAFALTDDEGRNYVLGLRDMPTKSAKHTMDAFEDILADVSERLAKRPLGVAAAPSTTPEPAASASSSTEDTAPLRTPTEEDEERRRTAEATEDAAAGCDADKSPLQKGRGDPVPPPPRTPGGSFPSTPPMPMPDDEAGDDSSTTDAGTQLLLNIVATMSDRAATEKLFNKNVEKLINDTKAAAGSLRDEDIQIAVELLNLYCGLHTLVHAAECVVSSTVSAEKGYFEGSPPIFNSSFFRANQSGAARLIETTCKAFSRGGDEKNGVYAKFFSSVKNILREKFDARSLPLTPFHGSRFNILFHNASVIYALRKEIADFLVTNAHNGLTKSCKLDINEDFYVAGTRAIAVLGKTNTKPLFAMQEDKEVDILQMGDHYVNMIAGLEEAAEKPEILLEGKSPFPEKYLRKDAWWDAVFEPDEVLDPLTIAILGIIIPPLIVFLRTHWKDHLPGGELAQLSADQAKGLPKTNKFPETIFGYFDRRLRSVPATSTLTIEACAMWAFNKTGDWIAAKGEDERDEIISRARKDVKSIREKYKERLETIVQTRRENLERERAVKEQQQRRKAAEVTTLCVKVQSLGGLWESDDDIKEGLKKLGNSDKVILDAIKSQMQYRRKVLEQKLPDAKMWNFSATNVSFSREQMIERLKVVIRQPLLKA